MNSEAVIGLANYEIVSTSTAVGRCGFPRDIAARWHVRIAAARNCAARVVTCERCGTRAGECGTFF